MISLHKHAIQTTIKDRYAHIVYSFDFENDTSGGSNELQFAITIAAQAFISGFEADIDGELFYGKTKEKEQASKEYSEAKKKNENAILITQPYPDISNVFEVKTNIDSGSKVSLKIFIEQYIEKKFNFNELNIEILRDFGYGINKKYDFISFTFDISDESGIFDVKLKMEQENNVKLSDENHMEMVGKIMNNSSINELTLKYKVKGEQNESNIFYDSKTNTFCHIISDLITNAIINNENKDNYNDDINEGYMDKINPNILIPRRCVIIIDRSGSMSGIKWTKTISSTITALRQLRCNYDRYCVILCGNHLVLHPEQQITITKNDNINKCIKILEKQQATGCELINDALLKGVSLIKQDIKLLNDDISDYNFYQNQIILLTDGEPTIGETDTNKIILNVKNVNDLSGIDKYSNKISVHSFGIGRDGNDGQWCHDLNHTFLKLLSLNNNGIYQRIKQTQTHKLLTKYHNILSKPILTNINVTYNNKHINKNSLTKTSFNTLYQGNDLIICGQFMKNVNISDNNILDVTVSAISAKQIKQNDNKIIIKPININKRIKLDLSNTIYDNLETNNNNNNNTERIWAYLKLQQLAENKLMHNDMIEIDDDEKKENDSYPLQLALKYEFVTPWTSMIVVKEKQQPEVEKDKPEVEKDKPEVEKDKSGAEAKRMRRKASVKFVSSHRREESLLDHLSDHDDYMDNERLNHKHSRRESIEMPDIFGDDNRYRHRRDSSAPVVNLGFEDPELLIRFEQLKVKDLECELEKTLNTLDSVKLEVDEMQKKKKENEEMNNELSTKLKKVMQSKSKLAQNCAMEICRLTNIVNKLSEIAQFKPIVKLLIDESYKYCIDIDNWKEWTYLQIVKWIISLKKGKYKLYEKILLLNMKNRKINGIYLARLGENELKSFGIEDGNDCKEIWNEIQMLIVSKV